MRTTRFALTLGLVFNSCLADPTPQADVDPNGDAPRGDARTPAWMDAGQGGASPPLDAAPPVVDPDASPLVVEPDAAPPVVDPDAAPPVTDTDAAPPVIDPDASPPVVDPDAAPTVTDPDASPPVTDPDASPPVLVPDAGVAPAVRPGAFEACHPAENPCAVGLLCALSAGEFLCFPPRVQMGERCLADFRALSDDYTEWNPVWLRSPSVNVDREPDGARLGLCPPGDICVSSGRLAATCLPLREVGEPCQVLENDLLASDCRSMLRCERVDDHRQCVPIESQPEGAACESHLHTCLPGLRCVGGRGNTHCHAALQPDGEACQDDRDCASDQCLAPGPDSVCAPSGALGEPCDGARDADCQAGLVCLDDRCAEPLSEGGLCDRPTRIDNVCADGLVCRGAGFDDRTCQPPLPSGAPCDWALGFNSGCGRPERCVDGICTPSGQLLCGAGGACPVGQQCTTFGTCEVPLRLGDACGADSAGTCFEPLHCDHVGDQFICTTRVALGELCDDAMRFCQAGTACRAPAPGLPTVCVAGGPGEACPCAAGLQCLRDGVCGTLNAGAEGDVCWHHAECGEDLRCNAVRQRCERLAAAGAGEPCTGTGFCMPGLVCPIVDRSVSATCVPFAQPGEPCDDTHACVPGTTCRGANTQTATCLVDLPAGVPCTDRFQEPGCAANGACRVVDGHDGLCGAPLAEGDTCYVNPGAPTCPLGTACRPLPGEPLAGVCR